MHVWYIVWRMYFGTHSMIGLGSRTCGHPIQDDETAHSELLQHQEDEKAFLETHVSAVQQALVECSAGHDPAQMIVLEPRSKALSVSTSLTTLQIVLRVVVFLLP